MLPPIKVKICDRDSNMNLHQIHPIKIKLKEIKNNEVNNPQLHPIKIKICDKDKNMMSAYENKKAKVKEKSGRVVIKDEREILTTDEILEVLSSDYVKPIRIKLSTLDLVYNWLYDLLFKFNFASIIVAGYAIVVYYVKFVVKLLFKAFITDTLVKQFGKFNPVLKLRHSIEVALDIFKEEGLFSTLKFQHKLSIFVTYNEKNLSPINMQLIIPDVKEVSVIRRVPRTIEELTSGTIEEQFLDGKTVFDILYKWEEVPYDSSQSKTT